MKYIQIFYWLSVPLIWLSGFLFRSFGEWLDASGLTTWLFIYSTPVFAILIVAAGAIALVLIMVIGIGVESVVTGKNCYKEYFPTIL